MAAIDLLNQEIYGIEKLMAPRNSWRQEVNE